MRKWLLRILRTDPEATLLILFSHVAGTWCIFFISTTVLKNDRNFKIKELWDSPKQGGVMLGNNYGLGFEVRCKQVEWCKGSSGSLLFKVVFFSWATVNNRPIHYLFAALWWFKRWWKSIWPMSRGDTGLVSQQTPTQRTHAIPHPVAINVSISYNGYTIWWINTGNIFLCLFPCWPLQTEAQVSELKKKEGSV